jgi:hypothetical protein
VLTDRGDGFYLLDQLLNEGQRLTAIATDDAHFEFGEIDAFGGFVMAKAEALDPDALLAALKSGQFYSSQGPRFRDIDVTLKEVRVECSPVDTIAILTGTSRGLNVTGRHITSAVFDIASSLQKAWVQTKPDPWFRIAIIDRDGRRAWTNPIWVDQLV